MCPNCTSPPPGRRLFLGHTLAHTLALATSGLAAPGRVQAAGGPHTSLNTEEAFARLKAGNEQYVKAPALCAAKLNKQRADVAQHQAPWATIVSCADSRVPPELLFGGLGVGELFVARNAGNMVDTATMGTIEYGSVVLGVPLIVVLGHERCGAVAAAVEVVEKRTRFPGAIGPMVNAIQPAAVATRGLPGDPVDNAVRESARRTAKFVLFNSSLIAELVKAGKLKVVAARYDLDDGRVEFLS